jgi:hypothetical protein
MGSDPQSYLAAMDELAHRGCNTTIAELRLRAQEQDDELGKFRASERELRGMVAAMAGLLKPFALAWQTWYANPRGPSAQNQVTNDQFLQAAKLLRDSHMTDLAALAAEAERGREEGGAA